MAKMFYSLEEAAEKLGIDIDAVRAKIESGELAEFRSGDELVVKREQVDLLAGNEGSGGGSAIELELEDIGGSEIGLSDSVMEDDNPIIDTGHDSLIIGLEDSAGGSFGLGDSAGESIGLTDSATSDMEPGSTSGATPADTGNDLGSGMGTGLGSGVMGSSIISLASEASGTGMEVESPKDQTGISIFDDGLDEVDASDATLITESPAIGEPEPLMDSAGSGSGLLDLTREGDDTSLGVDLLDEGYGGDEGGDAGVAPDEGEALFESPTGGEADLAQAVPMMAFQEAYDGSGSGLVGGAAFGIALTMLFVGAVVIFGLMNHAGTMIIEQLGGTMDIGVGEVPIAVLAAAGVTVLVAIIGWVMGKRG